MAKFLLSLRDAPHSVRMKALRVNYPGVTPDKWKEVEALAEHIKAAEDEADKDKPED